MSKKILSRDDILNINDIEIREVYIPEWKGSVLVKALSGAERDAFEESLLVGKGPNKELNMNNVRAKLVALSVVDKKGNRIFSDSDVKELSRKSATALQRIFAVAQKLSGLTEADIEELSKN